MYKLEQCLGDNSVASATRRGLPLERVEALSIERVEQSSIERTDESSIERVDESSIERVDESVAIRDLREFPDQVSQFGQ